MPSHAGGMAPLLLTIVARSWGFIREVCKNPQTRGLGPEGFEVSGRRIATDVGHGI